MLINVKIHDFARIENPCVGGSIPPRATKNMFDSAKRQPMQVGVFVLGRTKEGSDAGLSHAAVHAYTEMGGPLPALVL